MLFGILSGAESPEYDDTAGFRVAVCHCFHSDPNKKLYVAKYTEWYIMQTLYGLLMITSTIRVDFFPPTGGDEFCIYEFIRCSFYLCIYLIANFSDSCYYVFFGFFSMSSFFQSCSVCIKVIEKAIPSVELANCS